MLCVYISRGCCVAFTDCKVLCVDHMWLVRCHAQEAVRGRVFFTAGPWSPFRPASGLVRGEGGRFLCIDVCVWRRFI